MLTTIVLSFLISSWIRCQVRGQTNNGVFPFAINVGNGQEVVENAFQTVNQVDITTDFTNSGFGVYQNNKFAQEIYPVTDYAIFQGLDSISMFGTSLSMSDSYAVVGANGYDSFNGAVYVYSATSGGSWVLQAVLQSPDAFNSNFGLATAIDGTNIMVSANAADSFTGRVYIFSLNTYNVWVLSATIPSPLGTFENFGYSVALKGNYAVIGSANGFAFIYELVNQQWTVVKSLSSGSRLDYLGRSVALYGKTAVIGAYGYRNSVGQVYVYTRTGEGIWTLTATLQSVTGFNSQFGYSLAIYNTTIVVGAPGYRPGLFENIDNQTSDNSGKVHIFNYNPISATWTFNQTLDSPVGYNSYFGVAVKLSYYRLMVGADGYPSGNNTGGAFLYSRTAPGSTFQLNVMFPSPAIQSHFGQSVDVNDYFTAIGAYAFKDLKGAVYLATLPYVFAPSAAPTVPPAAINSQKTATSIGDLSIGVVAAIFLCGFLALGLAALVTYFCFCRAAPIVLEKKKKKEEEESPYTVHSYQGYTEMSQPAPIPRPPSMFPFFAPPMPPMMPPMDKKMMDGKDDKKMLIDKADPGFIRRLFPYKVYSYRGYKEGEDNNDDDQDPAKVKEELEKEGKSDGSPEKGGGAGGMEDNHDLDYDERKEDDLTMYYQQQQQLFQQQQQLYHQQQLYQQQYNHYPPPPPPPSNQFQYFNPNFGVMGGRDFLGDTSNPMNDHLHSFTSASNYDMTAEINEATNTDDIQAEIPAIEKTSSRDEVTVSTITNSVNVDAAKAKYARYLAAAKAATKPATATSPRAPNTIPVRQALQSPSVEIDVAMTEPMKLAALQEAREKQLRSDSLDPEARGNDLAQQDEVDRLRSIEAVRVALNSATEEEEDEERLRKNELNRLKEEEKLRNEEKIRARYAMFKAKAESEASLSFYNKKK